MGEADAERMRILELLEQRKITAAEAAELLSAVGQQRPRESGRRDRGRWAAEEPPPGDRPRWFRVRVTDTRTGRVRANVNVPLGMLGFGLGFARRWKMPGQAATHVDEILEAVRAGRRGTLVDVSDEDGGERVEIVVE